MKMKMKIEVLGDGCSSCQKLYENVIKAVKESGKEVEIVKVMDSEKFASYGVLSLPALVIDEVLKTSGKVSTVKKVTDWIKCQSQELTVQTASNGVATPS